MDQKELNDDLVQDMIDVLTSFCARLYGRRSAKNRAKKATDFPWMYEVSKCAPQEALRNLDRAFRNFFRGLKEGKKIGFPTPA